jgi:hypothetical protein
LNELRAVREDDIEVELKAGKTLNLDDVVRQVLNG